MNIYMNSLVSSNDSILHNIFMPIQRQFNTCYLMFVNHQFPLVFRSPIPTKKELVHLLVSRVGAIGCLDEWLAAG